MIRNLLLVVMVTAPSLSAYAATVAPIEADAVMSDDLKGNDRLLNALVDMVRESTYRCDSVSAARPFLISPGYKLVCNRFRYSYEIEDKGGHWIVTVD